MQIKIQNIKQILFYYIILYYVLHCFHDSWPTQVFFLFFYYYLIIYFTIKCNHLFARTKKWSSMDDHFLVFANKWVTGPVICYCFRIFRIKASADRLVHCCFHFCLPVLLPYEPSGLAHLLPAPGAHVWESRTGTSSINALFRIYKRVHCLWHDAVSTGCDSVARRTDRIFPGWHSYFDGWPHDLEAHHIPCGSSSAEPHVWQGGHTDAVFMCVTWRSLWSCEWSERLD